MITFYTNKLTPNGWKVAIVLEELGLQYENKFLPFDNAVLKGPEFTKINPNGRIPAIVDHDNGDFTLWESAAIIQYLVDRYDKDNKISFPHGTNEYALVAQWLSFQVSGQGPYYGQAAWFKRFHHEKLPSALDRYQKEIIRVVSVLDNALAGKKYLVGDKLTIVDLSFVPWDDRAEDFLSDSPHASDLKKYANYNKWHDMLHEVPGVKKYFEQRRQYLAEV